MTSGNVSAWFDFPMGPALRRYLGIDENDYQGASALPPSPETSENFQRFLMDLFPSQPPVSKDEFIDLLEELTHMKLTGATLHLAQLFRDEFPVDEDFRAQLAAGSAAMLEQELDEAEAFFRRAQMIEPAETAPYVNMAQIFFAQHRDKDALEWAESGLKTDPNQFRLWEIIGSIHMDSDQTSAGEKILTLAKSIQSFAGRSLAAELMAPGDSLMKAQLLEDLFHEGKRDPDFLEEYTAALGLAQQYEKIPTVIWQAERLGQQKLPWQVYAHGVQAFLAMNKEADALHLFAKMNEDQSTPDQIKQELQALYEQVKQENSGSLNHDH